MSSHADAARDTGTLIGALLGVAILALAGCLSPTGTPETGEASASGSMRRSTVAGESGDLPTEPFRTFNASGRINGDVRYLGIDVTAQHQNIRASVPTNATGLVAEIRFSGTVSDFDLVLLGPGYCPEGSTPQDLLTGVTCSTRHWLTKEDPHAYRASRGAPNPAPGQLRIELGPQQIAKDCRSDECSWSSIAWWNVAVDATYEMRLTVFYSVPVPSGFSAFS